MSSARNFCLSAYAFGYGCGFVRDGRPDAAAAQSITLPDLVEMCRRDGLEGIELPVDRYFPDVNDGSLESFIVQMQKLGLRVVFDLERFSSSYFRELAPIVNRYGEKFVRAKVCNFYGGNRFREPSYPSDKLTFCNEFQGCLDAIDQYGIRILVENHQDVTAKDLLDLEVRFGASRVGVNWDTGNSFPTGETTASFLEKLIHLIGNVHLKDYRLAPSVGGYVMHRCALGRGVVDFQRFVPLLLARHGAGVSFSIELGAMVGREALINDDRYWEHTEGVGTREIASVRSFIGAHLEEGDLRSPWEKGASPSEIAAAEAAEVSESIQYCKRLFAVCSR